LSGERGNFQHNLKEIIEKTLAKRYVWSVARAADWLDVMDDDAGAHKARVETGPDPVDRTAAAKYVAELSAELANLARRHGLDALGYILDMARLEAENATRHMNGRR
jgi:hypothetical protein